MKYHKFLTIASICILMGGLFAIKMASKIHDTPTLLAGVVISLSGLYLLKFSYKSQ